MALMRRSDWPSTVGGSLFSDLFDDDRFFTSPWMRGENLPATNIKENEKNFEIEVAVPGFKKNDINVTVDNGMLTVSAEQKQEEQKDEDSYKRREFSCRSFSRSFKLPENTKEDDITAKYEDGVLKLAVAKKQIEATKPKRPILIK
jgi:HSP20 family protein